MTEIACNLNVFTPEQRAEHEARAERVFAARMETQPTADGYRFRLPAALWSEAAAFVNLERLCCPFWDFRLELQSGGALWLTLDGPPGAKELLARDLGIAWEP
jgi:hypothetical protein